jgi:hypothetical protein
MPENAFATAHRFLQRVWQGKPGIHQTSQCRNIPRAQRVGVEWDANVRTQGACLASMKSPLEATFFQESGGLAVSTRRVRALFAGQLVDRETA